MKLSIYVPFFLTLCLATNARRFIRRSEIVPPPSCVPKAQIPVKSGSNIPPVSPNSNPGKNVPPLPSGNSTVVPNSTIPLKASSTNNTNSPPIFPRFSGFGFPSFLLEWQDLCLASGVDIVGIDSPCFFGTTRGLDALLATADPCAQQDVADAMITFAKSEGIINRQDLIAFAVAYRKQPREAVRILGTVPATPYCLRAPINLELTGIFNTQSKGVVIGVYGGPNYPTIKFGSPGSCPFGTKPDISSCTCVSGGGISSGGSSKSSSGTISTGDGTNSTTTDSSAGTSNSTETGGTSNSTQTSTTSNSTETGSTAGSSNSTETNTSTDGSSGNSTAGSSNSTETNTSTDGSSGNSTETDSTSGGSNSTDSNGSTGTNSTEGTTSDDSTGTDSTDETSPPIVPPGGDSSGDSETTQASQTATASTSAATGNGGFDGNINDPSGR